MKCVEVTVLVIWSCINPVQLNWIISCAANLILQLCVICHSLDSDGLKILFSCYRVLKKLSIGDYFEKWLMESWHEVPAQTQLIVVQVHAGNCRKEKLLSAKMDSTIPQLMYKRCFAALLATWHVHCRQLKIFYSCVYDTEEYRADVHTLKQRPDESSKTVEGNLTLS